MKKTIFLMSVLSLLLIGCAPRQIYPTISNYVGSRDFSKYRNIAVLPFADAPGAPHSGQIVQGLASQKFAQRGFVVVERARLNSVLGEQQLSLSGLIDTTQAIRIGKLLGVNAIVLGEVGQYTTQERHTDTIYFPIFISGQNTNIPIPGKQWTESFVSVSLRAIDVETSRLIYSGSGQYERGLSNPPQQLAEFILSDIIAGWIRDPAQPAPTNTARDNLSRKETREYSPEAIAWTEKSTKFSESKNWSEMIRTASVAISIDPSYPAAYVNRSWAYLEKGFPEKAFEDCRKALSLDSNNRGAFNNRGLYYLHRGEKDKAAVDFLKACNGGLEIGCKNFKLITGYEPKEKTDFCLKKAVACFNKKDWDGVIKYTSDIISDDASNEVALSIRAGAYAYKGTLNEAIRDCDAAIKKSPDFALAYNNKGFALELMGNKQEALLNYEFACNLKLPLGCNNLKKMADAMKKP
ncbi:MAG: CsgG/HfaB family protein [Syntrophales bacterium]